MDYPNEVQAFARKIRQSIKNGTFRAQTNVDHIIDEENDHPYMVMYLATAPDKICMDIQKAERVYEPYWKRKGLWKDKDDQE